jgi:hypothetical protein
MRLLRDISRAIARFNRWIGPTVAAESMVRDGGGMGGTHVDPVALDLLQFRLDERNEQEPRS